MAAADSGREGRRPVSPPMMSATNLLCFELHTVFIYAAFSLVYIDYISIYSLFAMHLSYLIVTTSFKNILKCLSPVTEMILNPLKEVY